MLNLTDMHKYKAAIESSEEQRIAGCSWAGKYNRLSTAAVRRLKHNSADHTAKEWAHELNATANTIRHRCKALGVTLKPFERNT